MARAFSCPSQAPPPQQVAPICLGTHKVKLGVRGLARLQVWASLLQSLAGIVGCSFIPFHSDTAGFPTPQKAQGQVLLSLAAAGKRAAGWRRAHHTLPLPVSLLPAWDALKSQAPQTRSSALPKAGHPSSFLALALGRVWGCCLECEEPAQDQDRRGTWHKPPAGWKWGCRRNPGRCKLGSVCHPHTRE